MSLFLLVLFPLSFLLAILAFFTGKTMASILTLGSYACFALFLLLSLHDINLRMMTQDISGIQDIYPSIESICIPAFLAFLRLQKNKCLFLCLFLYIIRTGIFDLGGIFLWIKLPVLLSTI